MTSRRILLINHDYPPLGGSSGNATRHIARGLARLGHRPCVLTAAWGDLPRTEEVDGVSIHRIWALRRSTGPVGTFEATSFAVAAMWAAPVLARKLKTDAVLAFSVLPGGLVGWFLKHLSHIPYVIALQGGDVAPEAREGRSLAPEVPEKISVLRRIIKRGIQHLWRNAGAVIANSNGLAQLARSAHPECPIDVIPAGADVDGITTKDDYGVKGEVKLLYVGRLAKHKGLDVLLPALARITSALKWKLTLVGDGPEWPVVAAQAARFALIDRIELYGWQGWNALPEIYRNADIFVLPSRDEGMPAALLEAMATGLPVVCTRYSGMGEAVLHSETGLLVPSGDSKALAEALTEMIADPSRWEPYGRAGRARVETYYSWTSVAEKWLAVMERVLCAKA